MKKLLFFVIFCFASSCVSLRKRVAKLENDVLFLQKKTSEIDSLINVQYQILTQYEIDRIKRQFETYTADELLDFLRNRPKN